MDKQTLYQQLPRITLRLFVIGLPAAMVFIFCWYTLDASHLWGRILAFFMDIIFDVSYDAKHAALAYHFSAIPGTTQTSEYAVNQMNSNLIVLVTLMATWPYSSFKDFLKVAAWCFLFTILYQIFSIYIQTCSARLGPELAGRLGIFWEDSVQHRVVRKIANFDKMILRYFGWFPIFLCSLVAIYFTHRRKGSSQPAKS